MGNDAIILLFVGFIGLILLFAQVKTFSIARDVERIREIMEEKN